MIAALYSFHKMTEKDAIALCSWKYEPPYDLFNFKDWDTMVAQAEEFGDPRIRDSQYRCVRDQQEALAGYVQFFPIGDWIRLGLGLRPDLCGQSFGLSFVEAAVLEASRLHPHARIVAGCDCRIGNCESMQNQIYNIVKNVTVEYLESSDNASVNIL
jgi:hypothetical protein